MPSLSTPAKTSRRRANIDKRAGGRCAAPRRSTSLLTRSSPINTTRPANGWKGPGWLVVTEDGATRAMLNFRGLASPERHVTAKPRPAGALNRRLRWWNPGHGGGRQLRSKLESAHRSVAQKLNAQPISGTPFARPADAGPTTAPVINEAEKGCLTSKMPCYVDDI